MFLRKKLIVAGGVVLGLTAAGVAYASLRTTRGGSGTGSVSAASEVIVQAVTLDVNTEGNSAVGVDPVNVEVTVHNPNPFSVRTGRVTAVTVTGVDVPEGSPPCPLASFVASVDPTAEPAAATHFAPANNVTLPDQPGPGASAPFPVGTVHFVSLDAPQDSCFAGGVIIRFSATIAV